MVLDDVCAHVTSSTPSHYSARLIHTNSGTFKPASYFSIAYTTPGRRQSKTLSTIDERGSKINRNSVFDFHLSPAWRQMAIENTVSIDFYLRSSIVLAFSIVAYPVCIRFARIVQRYGYAFSKSV